MTDVLPILLKDIEKIANSIFSVADVNKVKDIAKNTILDYYIYVFTKSRGVQYIEDYCRHVEDFANRFGMEKETYLDINVNEIGNIFSEINEYALVKTELGYVFNFSKVERKIKGSYYTPRMLVDLLIESALIPTVNDLYEMGGIRAVLEMSILDPAVGSGAFIIPAAKYVSTFIYNHDEKKEFKSYQDVYRFVLRHCMYSVDLDEYALKALKLIMWSEYNDPTLPLTIFDKQIKHGNALIGILDPAELQKLIKNGIPDNAYDCLTGDDPAFCKELKRINREQRERLKNPNQQLF